MGKRQFGPGGIPLGAEFDACAQEKERISIKVKAAESFCLNESLTFQSDRELLFNLALGVCSLKGKGHSIRQNRQVNSGDLLKKNRVFYPELLLNTYKGRHTESK